MSFLYKYTNQGKFIAITTILVITFNNYITLKMKPRQIYT